MIKNKVDFIFTIEVRQANPNGDPLTGNMPRVDSQGYGEISDVCLKRKIRNRMQDQGYEIFVKSNDRIDDGFYSLQKRYDSEFNSKISDAEVEKSFCEKWLDVRSFGQVITYDKRSIGIRGPVSIAIAKSLSPIEISSLQITRSTNGMDTKDGKRSSDTMGLKHFVEYGVYVVVGSVNCFYAERTGFNERDLDVLKESIRTLFVNDASSARPDGSMQVKDIYWFEHSSKIGNVSTAKIKDLLQYEQDDNPKRNYEDYKVHLNEGKLKEYEESGLKVLQFEGL
jgi:CRISPR-associated protein Cas7/Csd2 subtype I-C